MISNILSIAGSDPSGGAGIQADLKTFSALGCYGMATLTALTAQNTKGVEAVHQVPHDFVAHQIDAVFADIRVDAVKIGMAGSPQTIGVIGEAIQRHKPGYVILDPVMVATSGDRLLSEDAIVALRKTLVPLARVITPNVPEAEILLGKSLEHDFRFNMEDMAKALLGLGTRGVMLKGGHLGGPTSKDIYADEDGTLEMMEATRIKTIHNHGTGCTLSSALACYLAKGLPPAEAARASKTYVTHALQAGQDLKVGRGHGPVHHFHAFWK